MILDERNEFAGPASLSTAGTGRALVGDVIDTELVTSDLGAGEVPYLVISVSTAATSGGAATVVFEFVSDAQAAIATNGTATQHYASPSFAVAALTAGTRVACVPLPSGSYERYLGILQNVSTAALTAGAINAFLTKDPNIWRAYADAVN